LQIELHQLELRYRALRAAEPARRRKLLSAVCETGQQVPVVVVAAATAARYVLIDGYLRVDVLRSLGRDVVEATVWALSETEALIARFHMEGHARSTLEEAWLLEHLAKDEGLSLDELGRRLCRTKSWVSRRLGLRRILTTEMQAKVAAGQIPAQAAMKYLLPLARANGEHARKLVAGLCTQRVSVRQMGRLYAAYRAADAVGRGRLCDSPLVFLQMEAQTERAAEGQSTGVDRLISDLGAIAGLCGRARRRACTGISIEEIAVAQDRIGAAMGAARGAFAMLEQELGRRLDHDRPGTAGGDLCTAEQGLGDTSDRAGAQDLTQHGSGDSA
jgi:ParB family transcriptional regulator, chromosome partitioning protein